MFYVVRNEPWQIRHISSSHRMCPPMGRCKVSPFAPFIKYYQVPCCVSLWICVVPDKWQKENPNIELILLLVVNIMIDPSTRNFDFIILSHYWLTEIYVAPLESFTHICNFSLYLAAQCLRMEVLLTTETWVALLCVLTAPFLYPSIEYISLQVLTEFLSCLSL